MLATQAPFPQYFDLDGAPLDGGSLYFGAANQNPLTNPITVYWDLAGTQPAAQPIKTINGYAARAGTPAILYAPTDYSQVARDVLGRTIFYAASSVAFSNSSTKITGISADAQGAVGDNATLNNTAIAAAIALAGQGGVVNFTAGGVYLHAQPIVHGGTTLQLNGATLKYTGAAQQVTGPTTGTSAYGGIVNGTLDSTSSTCTQVLQIRSGFNCKYKDLTLKVNSATAAAYDLVCNSTGTGDPAEGTLNTVGCIFDNVTVVGTIGRVYRLCGNFSAGTVQQAVTLNNWINCNHYGNCTLVGLDEVQACDNNHWIGVSRIECNTAGAVGRITNSSNPGGNAGVYANNADNLAIDTFGSYGGRIGWKLNYSKDSYSASFFQNPPAEGGALVVNGALSFDVTIKEVNGTNYSSKHLYGHNLGVGTLALPNVGCVVSFPATTGASQYGTLSLMGPDNTVATAAAYAGYVTTLPQVYTVPIAIGYYAPAAVKGAGSTITNDYAFYAADRSAGVSNFGFYSAIAMGANKWTFFGGTAASQFGGLVSVNGLAQTGKTIVNNNAATAYNVTTAYNAASISYLAFTGTNAASIAFTFTAAASVPDGWRVDIYTQAAVGAVTWASTGATFVGAPTSLGANSTTRFIFHAATNQWLPA